MASRTTLLVTSERLSWPAVRSLLATFDDVVIAGEATTLAGAVNAVRALTPDIVITESRIEGRPILPLLDTIDATVPRCAVVVLAEPFEAPVYVRAGARTGVGFFLWSDLKESTFRVHLASAMTGEVKKVHRLIERLGRETERELALVRAERAARTDQVKLSEREQQVLALLREGCSQEDIARRMHLSVSSVKRAVRCCRERFDAPSVPALVAKMGQRGLPTCLGPQPGEGDTNVPKR
jgi:DNA-binding NarL/FixJ family response regulator